MVSCWVFISRRLSALSIHLDSASTRTYSASHLQKHIKHSVDFKWEPKPFQWIMMIKVSFLLHFCTPLLSCKQSCFSVFVHQTVRDMLTDVKLRFTLRSRTSDPKNMWRVWDKLKKKFRLFSRVSSTCCAVSWWGCLVQLVWAQFSHLLWCPNICLMSVFWSRCFITVHPDYCASPPNGLQRCCSRSTRSGNTAMLVWGVLVCSHVTTVGQLTGLPGCR